VVELGAPISENPVENLTVEEQRGLKAGKTEDANQLQTGIWYVNLDPEGNPVGPISATPPEDPLQPFITVTNTDPIAAAELTTSSGAPLTNQMNPEHSHYDQGLAERNPVPPPVLDPTTGKINRQKVAIEPSKGYRDAEKAQLERQKQHEAEKAARTAPAKAKA
jgi:hypothetical protein